MGPRHNCSSTILSEPFFLPHLLFVTLWEARITLKKHTVKGGKVWLSIGDLLSIYSTSSSAPSPQNKAENKYAFIKTSD